MRPGSEPGELPANSKNTKQKQPSTHPEAVRRGTGESMRISVAVRLCTLVAALSLAGYALAQGPGGGPGPGQQSGPDHQFGEHRPPFERAFGGPGTHGRWWNNPKVAEQLKLTDEQKKAFDDILMQHRTTLIDLRGNVEKAELALEPLIRDDQPNRSEEHTSELQS